MRPQVPQIVTDKPKQEGIDERDERMEQRYSYDRRGERSTLAFVDTYRDELAEEFFAWRRQMEAEGTWTGEGIFDALRRWERGRFGADLDVGSHGLLSFAVRIKLAPEEGGRRLPTPGYFDKTVRLVRPLPRTNATTLAAKAARGMDMPRQYMSRREKDERLMELERQKQELISGTEEP